MITIFSWKRRVVWGLFVLGIFAFTGCTAFSPTPTPPSTQPGVVKKPKKTAFVQAREIDIALALPLSGPYSVIGTKILAGAKVASQALMAKGSTIRIHEIDTSSQGWEQQLEALPDNVRVVGGPLRPNIFEDIALTQQNKKRVCFTFMQNLKNATEGRDAWRFFSSPHDQIRTMIQVAKREFGITNIGILYPDEPFGERIAQLFLEQSQQEGVNIKNMKRYPPDSPLQWSDIVSDFLYSQQGQDGGGGFDAVFLPDVWSKVEMLVPYFFYHQRENILVLGSTLWGQTLSKDKNVNVHNFKLAVFPDAFWARNNVPATRDLSRVQNGEDPTFWEVLGYDFVRFVGVLGEVPESWDAAGMNRQIQQAQNRMTWSMAPVIWNSDGMAKQDFFVFTPTTKGMKPANFNEMHERLRKFKTQ